MSTYKLKTKITGQPTIIGYSDTIFTHTDFTQAKLPIRYRIGRIEDALDQHPYREIPQTVEFTNFRIPKNKVLTIWSVLPFIAELGFDTSTAQELPYPDRYTPPPAAPEPVVVDPTTTIINNSTIAVIKSKTVNLTAVPVADIAIELDTAAATEGSVITVSNLSQNGSKITLSFKGKALLTYEAADTLVLNKTGMVQFKIMGDNIVMFNSNEFRIPNNVVANHPPVITLIGNATQVVTQVV